MKEIPDRRSARNEDWTALRDSPAMTSDFDVTEKSHRESRRHHYRIVAYRASDGIVFTEETINGRTNVLRPLSFSRIGMTSSRVHSFSVFGVYVSPLLFSR